MCAETWLDPSDGLLPTKPGGEGREAGGGNYFKHNKYCNKTRVQTQ